MAQRTITDTGISAALNMRLKESYEHLKAAGIVRNKVDFCEQIQMTGGWSNIERIASGGSQASVVNIMHLNRIGISLLWLFNGVGAPVLIKKIPPANRSNYKKNLSI